MHRRDWLMPASAPAPAAPRWPRPPTQPPARRPPLKITDVKTILTAPADIRLVVVKVLTSEPGLYGLGCATFTQRARVVETAVDKYLKPFLIGKDPLQIEDIWQSSLRQLLLAQRPGAGQRPQRRGHGPVGHPRQARRHAGLPAPRRQVPQGRRHLPPRQRRARSRRSRRPCAGCMDAGLPPRPRPGRRARPGDLRRRRRRRRPEHGAGQRRTAGLGAAALRPHRAASCSSTCASSVGDEVELLHDMHERVPPILAMQLAKDLEPYSLFFLEDPFSPEDVGYFAKLRQQTTHADRDGRAVQQPQRVAAAGHAAG